MKILGIRQSFREFILAHSVRQSAAKCKSQKVCRGSYIHIFTPRIEKEGQTDKIKILYIGFFKTHLLSNGEASCLLSMYESFRLLLLPVVRNSL